MDTTPPVDRLRSLIDSPAGKLFTWTLPKFGWLILIWFIWSAKTYTIEYIDRTPAVLQTREAIAVTNKQVEELNKLNVKQNNVLEHLIERQDKADKAFERTLDIQQTLSTAVAVQASRLDSLERSRSRIGN